MATTAQKQLIQRCVPAEPQDDDCDVAALFRQLNVSGRGTEVDKAPVSPSDFVSLQSIRCSALARRPNTTMKFARYAETLLSDLLNKDCAVIEKGKTNEEKTETEGESQEKENSTDDKVGTEEPIAKNNEEKNDVVIEIKQSKTDETLTEELQTTETVEEETTEKEVKNCEETESVKSEGESAASSEVSNIEEVHKTEQSEQSDDSSSEEGELLSRGPVRHSKNWNAHHHPYQQGQQEELQYGAAALSTVHDFTAFSNYGGGYECGITWGDSPDRVDFSQSSTPDTMLSDQGYSSCSPVITSPGTQVREKKRNVSQDLNRLLDCKELPDTLADFILKFSHTDKEGPYSVNSAYSESPEGPLGSQSGPTTPNSIYARRCYSNSRNARSRLRQYVPVEDLEAAWAWVLVNHQMILDYKPDGDGDSLLHILAAQQDVGKVYALVEHYIKADDGKNSSRKHDIPNKNNETPFYFSVIQGNIILADYFLELGVDTNMKSYRGDQDTALHHACARGLTSIVKSLCHYPTTDINATNAKGQTPLMLAIRSHKAIEEGTNRQLENIGIINLLLKKNADPTIVDYNGRTVVHYIVETGVPDLLDCLRSNVDEGMVTQLVNQPDYQGISPMSIIRNISNIQERTSMVLPMLTCGAGLQ